VRKLSGDAAVAVRPADQVQSEKAHANPQTKRSYKLEFNFRQTGKPRLAQDCREDHYTPEKFRMECVWKNLLRRY
jgi:hypothetical protein